jgi:hypothetical protein
MSDDLSRYVEIKDEETLNAVVAHWQGILGLRDWHIDAYLVSQCDLDHADAEASCARMLERKSAQIRVMKPDELLARVQSDNGRRYYPRDTMEQLVVHELVHIHLGVFERAIRDGNEDMALLAEEQVTNALTLALTSGPSGYFKE